MLGSKNNKYNHYKDEALMISIYNGDVYAFNELYGRYKSRLLYYFYRMLGNSKEKSQDFLQEIFIKIIERPELFNSSRRFSTWIFSIAHNMCKNEYRSQEVRKIIKRDEHIDIIQEEDSDNDSQEQIELLFRELELLEEVEKTAFILRYREGFSIKEISVVLDLAEGTVKSRLFYTRKKLIEKLQIKNY